LLYDEENGDPNEFKYKDDSDDIDYKYLEDNEGATKPSDYKFIQS